MDKYIGTRLEGRYKIEELIGEGGMANVYRAHDLKEDRVVAVKILKEEFLDNEEVLKRFKNESRAISVLNHPNIVKVYDVNVVGRDQYIAMENIEGITLKEYIEQRGEPLTYKETVHFVSQVLLALQHAHDRGVVHRDIKPQNIMITESGQIKVMDFGIARLARSEVHTATDQAIGSVHYISPEQAQGGETDMRSDIYSTGIMMYEMLTGRLPFESDSVVSIAIKQISDAATPVRKVNPSVPEALEEITLKAMAKDPRLRYQSALDMMRDLDEFKRDPSIKFEYDYLTTQNPARQVEMNLNSQKSGDRQPKAPPKKRKPRRIPILIPAVAIITTVVVLFCGFTCWDLLMNSGNPLFSTIEEIELPDWRGKSIEEVKGLLNAPPYNYLRLEIEEEYNPDVPAGHIISQNPSPNKQVKQNQKVTLVVSREPGSVEVPDLRGFSRMQATEIIHGMGMRPYVRLRDDPSVGVGQVVDTDPKMGAVVPQTPDTIITIYVRGTTGTDYERTVPDIVGLDIEEAKIVLQEAGFEIGYQYEDYSDLYPAGTVMEQTPEQGSIKMVGSLVSVVVSLGPLPPPEPEETGGGGSPPPITPPSSEVSSVPSAASSESASDTGGGATTSAATTTP